MRSQLYISKRSKRNIRNGLLFVSPFLIGFACFVTYPIVASLYYSFCDFNIFQKPTWIGIENYKNMVRDDLFVTSVYNTLYYTLLYIPFSLFFGIGMALLLNTKIKGLSIYRTIYYLPTLVPTIAASILWIQILDPTYGLINNILRFLGINGPGWIADPKWSKLSLVVMGFWGIGGSVIIYLAGLQDVPQQLYEAAELDGASNWQKVIYVTLPMISPIILFNLIMGIIGALQYFTQAYVMTNGGPANSTLFYSLYLYRNAFQFFHMGYASAMAWLLFIATLLCNLIVLKSSVKWVYYGGTR